MVIRSAARRVHAVSRRAVPHRSAIALGFVAMLAVAVCAATYSPGCEAGAPVYSWTDAEGRKHYGDAPPPGRKAEQVKIRIQSYSGPAVVSRAPASARGTAKKVRLFGAVWCGYCKLAKAHFAHRGIPFEDLDVDRDARARAEYERLGGQGVPLILVGDQKMTGYDPAPLDDMLRQAGYR